MGLMVTPYHECQAVSTAMEVVIGDRKVKYNPFRWSEVALNFLGGL